MWKHVEACAWPAVRQIDSFQLTTQLLTTVCGGSVASGSLWCLEAPAPMLTYSAPLIAAASAVTGTLSIASIFASFEHVASSRCLQVTPEQYLSHTDSLPDSSLNERSIVYTVSFTLPLPLCIRLVPLMLILSLIRMSSSVCETLVNAGLGRSLECC